MSSPTRTAEEALAARDAMPAAGKKATQTQKAALAECTAHALGVKGAAFRKQAEGRAALEERSGAEAAAQKHAAQIEKRIEAELAKTTKLATRGKKTNTKRVKQG